MQLTFTKMHGLGNDFVVINAIQYPCLISTQQIQRLADRHFGIGFDQLLIIEASTDPKVDVHYRIFNADGSEVGQCGNGVRCVARYLLDKGLTTKQHLVLSAQAGVMRVEIDGLDAIRVNMGKPILEPAHIPLLGKVQANQYILDLFESEQVIMAVSMGNPHAIILVEDIEQAPLDTVGKRIAKHPDFPEGVNVSFMQVKDRSHVALRVLERGTGETLACGTGACAAVVGGIINGLLDATVAVTLLGGDLNIIWLGDDHPVWMTGPAVCVFEGSMEWDDNS